jgi:hypothetical protein
MNKGNVLKFFNFIYERQNIFHKKEVLKLPPPWTDDDILKKYHFCNVYRESDKGSRYLIDSVLNKDLHPSIKLLNIVAYRFFNQVGLFDNIFDNPLHPRHFDFKSLEDLLDNKIKDKVQLFNTAYVSFGRAYNTSYRQSDKHVQILLVLKWLSEKITNESFCENLQIVVKPTHAIEMLKKIHGVGDFMAGQIMVDLTYTNFFTNGFTSNDFCIVGPGAVGGIQHIEPDIPKSKMQEYCIRLRDVQEEMFNQLKEDTGKDWLAIHYKNAYCCVPYLSAMDIQSCLCEWRKYHKWPTESSRKRYYDYEGKYGVKI